MQMQSTSMWLRRKRADNHLCGIYRRNDKKRFNWHKRSALSGPVDVLEERERMDSKVIGTDRLLSGPSRP